jgi:hypothetical protein
LEIELKYKGECLEFIIQTFPYLIKNQAINPPDALLVVPAGLEPATL